MTRQLEAIAHFGCDTLFLEEVLDCLDGLGITQPILFRASEMDKLERVLVSGTDRAGYGEGLMWEAPGLAFPHEDVILATKEEDIRRGEREPEYSTSFKKFGLRGEPLLLIYDAAKFQQLAMKEYRFLHADRKCEALLAVIPVDLQGEIPGWFTTEEGLGYRALVAQALGRASRGPDAGRRVVEVGCWHGRSTAWIARFCGSRSVEVVAVDHYQGSSDQYDSAYRATLAREDVAGQFIDRMNLIGSNVRLMREDSAAAATRFRDVSIDLVFIDGSHNHASVSTDLRAWWPSVKFGGLLAGHDFDQEHPGVIAAVTEFALEIGRPLSLGPGSLWSLER